jgi:large subunit ribosomal protein L23
MALFGSKKNTVKKAPAKKAESKEVAVKAEKTGSNVRSFAHVLSRPRVTEKSAIGVERTNTYTFEIAKAASKHDVMRAIQETYKVKPRKVNIIRLPNKVKFIRGKMGTKTGVKKAVVFLDKEDKIEFA